MAMQIPDGYEGVALRSPHLRHVKNPDKYRGESETLCGISLLGVSVLAVNVYETNCPECEHRLRERLDLERRTPRDSSGGYDGYGWSI